eukprot:2099833-Amphidinium_carterae.2
MDKHLPADQYTPTLDAPKTSSTYLAAGARQRRVARAKRKFPARCQPYTGARAPKGMPLCCAM